MSSSEQNQEQKSGIFEPKPLNPQSIPESGAKKAFRIAAAAVALIVILMIAAWCRQLWFHPVKRFYKGLSRRNETVMEDAFPSWLVNADFGEENVTIADMCSILKSGMDAQYGQGSKVKTALAGYSEVDAEKLTQIADGIQAQFQIKAEVSKGRVCTMNVRYTAANGETYEKTEYVTMYRINGHWCILDVPNQQK